MLDEKSQSEVDATARTTGIIVFGLCAGLIIFRAYALFFHDLPQNQAPGFMTYLSLVVAGFETLMCLIVPRSIVVKSPPEPGNLKARKCPTLTPTPENWPRFISRRQPSAARCWKVRRSSF